MNFFKGKPKIEITNKDIIFIGGSCRDNLSPETDYCIEDWKNVYTMLFEALKKFPSYRLVLKEKGEGALSPLPMFIANKVGFDKKRILILRNIDPISLMQNSNLVISTDSTMILDALSLNKEVISIRIKRIDKYYPFNHLKKIMHMIYNEKELERELSLLLLKGGEN